MANKRFALGTLAMVLVFGMTIAGCDLFGNDDDRTNNVNNDSIVGGLFAGSPPILPSATPINLAGTTVYVMGQPITTGYTIIDKAIAFVNANPGTYTLVLDSDVDVSLPRQLTSSNTNLTVIGIGEERTITQTGMGSIFTVGIALADMDTNISLTLGENVILQGRTGNNLTAVTVRGGASLIMQDNARISGNTPTVAGGGGGVFLQGGAEGSPFTTFTMRDDASVDGNSRFGNGGGVFVDANAVFSMYGNASVSGNSTVAVPGSFTTPPGGGVHVMGFFNMNGGTVSGNTTAGGLGGGVHVGSTGTFLMGGGVVYGSGEPAPLANNASIGAALAFALMPGSAVARYGYGGNILPHTDGNSLNTNNTIRGRSEQYFTIDFDMQGGYPQAPWQAVPPNGLATRPTPNFTREGYNFAGWFGDSEFTVTFDFGTAITDSITLYARWVESTCGLVFERIAAGYAVTGFTGSATEIIIPAYNNGLAVVAIGDNAFSGNQITGELIIPDSVTTIGNSAFIDNQITGLTIGNSVTTIGENAFRGNQITSLIIPNSVTTIRWNAFSGNQITGELIIPDSVTTIASDAFIDNQITGLTIGNRVTTIGEGAFSGNQITGELIIPDSVTTIGNRAFQNNQITDLTIGNRVTTIGFNAFSDNQITGELIIPDSVTTIGSNAFSGNRITGELIIPDSVTTIGNRAFQNNQITGLTIGNRVTTIWIDAFSGNQITGELIIPDNVTTIWWSAFGGNQITSLTIGNSVTSIEQNAFWSNQITSITIPSDVAITDAGTMGTHGYAFFSLYNNNGRLAGTYTFADGAWTLQP